MALAPEATFTTTRVPKAELGNAPYQSIGRLFYNKGWTPHACSGALVGPTVVLTAAHCAYSLEEKSWSTHMLFDPQFDDGVTKGSFAVVKMFVLTDWLDNEDYTADYAILVLGQRATLPCLGLLINQPARPEYISVGYPALPISNYDFDGKHMWQCDGPTEWSGDPDRSLMGNNMTNGGSGGPWLTSLGGKPSILAQGVNSTNSPDTNPTMMYSPVFDQGLNDLYTAATGGETLWQTSLPGQSKGGSAHLGTLSRRLPLRGLQRLGLSTQPRDRQGSALKFTARRRRARGPAR